VLVALNSNMESIKEMLEGELSSGVSVEQLKGMIYGFCKLRA